jgi:hypothetical protein
MSLLSLLLVLLMLGVWLFGATTTLLSARNEAGPKRFLLLVAPFFLALGALGFFGTAISSIGGLNWLPQSFEWPIGAASGVVETSDRFFVVPHTASGRIQVYDPHWKFTRGWHVDAGAGTFHLFISDPDRINVITARGQWHYVYSIEGTLLSAEHYPPGSYDSFPRQGTSHIVPTPLWLWTFTSPAYSWLAAMLGIVLLVLKEKIAPKKQTLPSSANSS